MGFWEEFKTQTRGTKLLFNFLFHGFHVGLFAFGWYVTWMAGDGPNANRSTGGNKQPIRN
jgi:hypothetical protein